MNRRLVCLGAGLLSLLAALVALAQQGGQETSPQRAPLPTFDRSLSSQFFFDDAFATLVGERPADPSAVVVVANPAAGGGNAPAAAAASGGFAWSKLISPTTIEDEVKAIKLAVDQNITTPSEFAGRGYKRIRREFSVLAMLFAIISQYDSDVRWKEESPAARDVFGRLASNAKAGGNENVFKEAKLRQEDLGNLLRGSGLNVEAAGEENEWDSLVDRSQLMQRLEAGFNGKLQGWTGSADQFSENIESVLHEAEIIAAISEVLTQEGMIDGDDEDYAGFAKRMKTAASEVVAAVKLNNSDQARQAAGEINKACSECHEFYR